MFGNGYDKVCGRHLISASRRAAGVCGEFVLSGMWRHLISGTVRVNEARDNKTRYVHLATSELMAVAADSGMKDTQYEFAGSL